MRIFVAACILVAGLLVPGVAQAQATDSVTFSHALLGAHELQTIIIRAHDLRGQPMRAATVMAHLNDLPSGRTLHLPKTDANGNSRTSFLPLPARAERKITVTVTVNNGYLQTTSSGSFRVKGTPAAVPSRKAMLVGLHLLPSAVTVPQNLAAVVAVHTLQHLAAPGATVTITATFVGGVHRATGWTDGNGLWSGVVSTAGIPNSQTVHITVDVVWHRVSAHAHGAVQVQVIPALATPQVPGATSPSATPTPYPSSAPATATGSGSAPIPTATIDVEPTWTPTPVPTPSPVPSSTPWSLPTPTPSPPIAPVGQPSFTPTATTIPTVDLPVFTATPTSTSTSTPVPSPTPRATSTATAVPTCPGSQDGCIQAILNLMNQERFRAGVQPLALDSTTSTGTSSCIGSIGHSKHMSAVGYISHDQFPSDVCVRWSTVGENVGENYSGNELTDLQTMHDEMMAEPHSASYCRSGDNHACNILNANYVMVGIGIYVSNGTTWLTEDFTG